jgi:hypothetical protein
LIPHTKGGDSRGKKNEKRGGDEKGKGLQKAKVVGSLIANRILEVIV